MRFGNRSDSIRRWGGRSWEFSSCLAQMEREATGERTREAINHIRKSGYHFGKVPYGKRKIPAPDNPRMKILVDDEEESAVIAQLSKRVGHGGSGISEMAKRLNAKGTKPPQGVTWTRSLLYNLRLRLESHHSEKPQRREPTVITRSKERILELRAHGHSLRHDRGDTGRAGMS